MQFDKTRIAIRERGYLDLLDLAIQLVRAHAGPLLVTSLLGAVPMAALNIWLLGGAPVDDLIYADTPDDRFGSAFLYFLCVTLLVVWQMPLASALTTLYLGQAVFEERPRGSQIALDFLKSLPQLIVCQVILRGLLIPWGITWFVLFAVWPYLNEIILLERNPLLKSRRGSLTTFRRSSGLHSASAGELFGRWIMAACAGTFWGLAIWLSIWFVRGELTENREFDWAMYTVYLQLAIWLVLSYFAVVRFLSYLDLRIKTEGWEIELRMRAEAARLGSTQ